MATTTTDDDDDDDECLLTHSFPFTQSQSLRSLWRLSNQSAAAASSASAVGGAQIARVCSSFVRSFNNNEPTNDERTNERRTTLRRCSLWPRRDIRHSTTTQRRNDGDGNRHVADGNRRCGRPSYLYRSVGVMPSGVAGCCRFVVCHRNVVVVATRQSTTAQRRNDATTQRRRQWSVGVVVVVADGYSRCDGQSLLYSGGVVSVVATSRRRCGRARR